MGLGPTSVSGRVVEEMTLETTFFNQKTTGQNHSLNHSPMDFFFLVEQPLCFSEMRGIYINKSVHSMVFQRKNTTPFFLRHVDVENFAEIADVGQVQFRVFVQPVSNRFSQVGCRVGGLSWGLKRHQTKQGVKNRKQNKAQSKGREVLGRRMEQFTRS